MKKKMKKHLIILTVMVIISIIVSFFVSGVAGNLSNDIFFKPSLKYFFGTDSLGRNIFIECVVGTRNTFFIGLAITIISGAIGILIGGLCSMLRDSIDSIITEIINIIVSIPMVFVFLLVFSVFSMSSFLVIIVLSLSLWTSTAKIVRTEVKSCMQETFIKQQLLLGESKVYIFFKHIVPHIYKPVVSNLALVFASACITESGLSFIGVKCAELSLGTILNYGKDYVFSAWWICAFPSIILVVM